MLWLLVKPVSLGVRLLMIRDGQVLLVKHVYEPEWYLPGGAVENGETLEEAVRREAREETGATLRRLQLFGAYTHTERGTPDHVITFLSENFDLTCQSDDEIEFCRFFPLDALPEPLSSGSASRIREYRNGQIGTFGAW